MILIEQKPVVMGLDLAAGSDHTDVVVMRKELNRQIVECFRIPSHMMGRGVSQFPPKNRYTGGAAKKMHPRI